MSLVSQYTLWSPHYVLPLHIQILKLDSHVYMQINNYVLYQECIRESTELYTHNINHVVM